MPETGRLKQVKIELHGQLGGQLGGQKVKKKGGFYGVYYQKRGQKRNFLADFRRYITCNNNVT